MKKIIASAMLVLSFAGSAFATGTVMSSNGVAASGTSIFGGIDDTTAASAVNPLIKLSNKVTAVVNWTTAGTPATSPGYAIGTKHNGGTKLFGTSNTSTSIFWKLDAAGQDITGAKFGSDATNNNFSAAASWTAY